MAIFDRMQAQRAMTPEEFVGPPFEPQASQPAYGNPAETQLPNILRLLHAMGMIPEGGAPGQALMKNLSPHGQAFLDEQMGIDPGEVPETAMSEAGGAVSDAAAVAAIVAALVRRKVPRKEAIKQATAMVKRLTKGKTGKLNGNGKRLSQKEVDRILKKATKTQTPVQPQTLTRGQDMMPARGSQTGPPMQRPFNAREAMRDTAQRVGRGGQVPMGGQGGSPGLSGARASLEQRMASRAAGAPPTPLSRMPAGGSPGAGMVPRTRPPVTPRKPTTPPPQMPPGGGARVPPGGGGPGGPGAAPPPPPRPGKPTGSDRRATDRARRARDRAAKKPERRVRLTDKAKDVAKNITGAKPKPKGGILRKVGAVGTGVLLADLLNTYTGNPIGGLWNRGRNAGYLDWMLGPSKEVGEDAERFASKRYKDERGKVIRELEKSMAREKRAEVKGRPIHEGEAMDLLNLIMGRERGRVPEDYRTSAQEGLLRDRKEFQRVQKALQMEAGRQQNRELMAGGPNG